MRIEFGDSDLRRLYEEATDFRIAKLGSDLVKAFRKKVFLLEGVNDERDLYAFKSLHFEKLLGDRAGQHSIRLNDQWRLILELHTDEDGRLLLIISIEDYH